MANRRVATILLPGLLLITTLLLASFAFRLTSQHFLRKTTSPPIILLSPRQGLTVHTGDTLFIKAQPNRETSFSTVVFGMGKPPYENIVVLEQPMFEATIKIPLTAPSGKLTTDLFARTNDGRTFLIESFVNVK